MLAFLIKAKDLALDILFPPICANCQKPLEKNQSSVCEECIAKIHLNNTLFCPVCRARLAENKKICHFDCPYLLGASGNYDDPILQNLIQSFKYKGIKSLSSVLTDLLIRYLGYLSLVIDRSSFVIVPVPLFSRREKERGFNQSKLIAKNLAEKLNLEFCDALLRVKATKSQAQTRDSEERAKNVEGCFEIINPEFIKDRNIILIDDVFTSGATINEAVKILKQNNAKKILALVTAKA
ncbi:MAG: ComF family protein [Candidatus Paceibacterota bacterium]|jgi:ComF family protein